MKFNYACTMLYYIICFFFKSVTECNTKKSFKRNLLKSYLRNKLDIKKSNYYTEIKIKFFNLRITPIIWFGGLYQEPVIPDYEESTFVLSS